ncbi:phage antirepressor Ant, partial [Enterococcus faecium]
GAYQEIQTAIYEEVDRRAGSSLKTRLTNLRNRMAGEGVSKSKRDKTNKLDVIESDKRLKEIYLSVVKDFAIKYGVWKEK